MGTVRIHLLFCSRLTHEDGNVAVTPTHLFMADIRTEEALQLTVLRKYDIYIYIYIQGVPGGKVSILGGHIIGHSKQKTL
jgi:hypothetical protein